jgi:hypothetical protein
MNDFDLPVNKSSLVFKRIVSFEKATYNTEKLALFNGKDLFNLGRSIETIDFDFIDVICTTYFSTKLDPQRKNKIQTNSIEYIAPWYNSMIALKLCGIVFYDDLSEEFIKEYQTDNIKFLKCTLGSYSLNDERFILYYMFFLKHKVKNILLTDGNDVIITKAPFEFFESKKETTIFVGRGRNNKLFHSKWNLRSIHELSQGLDVNLPNNFYEMAIYNAGIIGGNYYAIMYFLRQMCFVFLKIDNDKNNNMAAMHYVLYYYFFPNCRKWIYRWFYNLTDKDLKVRILNKIKDLKLDKIVNDNINYKQDRTAVSHHIFSGFPLNSKFKFFETDSETFLIHK